MRNAIVDRERIWLLEPDALGWRDDKGRQGRMPYADIASLQLIDYASFDGRIYQCAVQRRSGSGVKIRSHSYVSLGRFEDRLATYAPFIRELAGRVADANPEAEFIAGSTGLWIVWTVVGLLAIVMLGFFFASFGAGGPSVNGTIMVVVILLVGGPIIWRQLKYGKAKSFDPRAVPPELIGDA
ncbi:hypothetical protein [Methyloligella halotolerans]|uniref:hypothetical protein n=1 Tax=Methyloligella halotolerans TaxID=1177755 RepID=UPI00114D304D|nr:hypothetical protein [Methyloligella halotolerans]